jgi:hypothetical protein
MGIIQVLKILRHLCFRRKRNYDKAIFPLRGILWNPGLNNSNDGFDLSNTFEAKVEQRQCTKVESKKIMLLNNLNLSTSYNLDADGVTSPCMVTSQS